MTQDRPPAAFAHRCPWSGQPTAIRPQHVTCGKFTSRSLVAGSLAHDDILGLHSREIAPRLALWSSNEPVTLFGAERTGRGWDEVGPASEHLAASFTGSQSCEYQVLAADSSGDLGYVVAFEHSVAASYGREPEEYTLWVTHLSAGERRMESRSPAWGPQRCCRPDAFRAGLTRGPADLGVVGTRPDGGTDGTTTAAAGAGAVAITARTWGGHAELPGPVSISNSPHSLLTASTGEPTTS